MSRQFHNKRQSLTVTSKQAGVGWANYLTDEKNFTGHMFNIELEENSHKMSFKALPVKIQRSKNIPPPSRQIGLKYSPLREVSK